MKVALEVRFADRLADVAMLDAPVKEDGTSTPQVETGAPTAAAEMNKGQPTTNTRGGGGSGGGGEAKKKKKGKR